MYMRDEMLRILNARKEMHMKDLSKENNIVERERIEGQIRECNNLIFIVGTNEKFK